MADDQEWRGFDARLERLEGTVRELDELMRGSRRIRTPGLSADIDRMELELRKLNAVVFEDSTGTRGIAANVNWLMGRKKDRETSRGYRSAFWIMLIGALITAATAILTNRDQVMKWMPKYHPGPVEAAIDKGRHPRSKHKTVIKRIVPAKEVPNDASPAQVPPVQ